MTASSKESSPANDGDMEIPKPFHFTVPPGSTTVLLDCEFVGDSPESLADVILEDLLEEGIARPPDKTLLVELLRRAEAKGAALKGAEIVKEAPPVPPEDGRIEWGADFFSTAFVKDEKTGRVDFHQRAAQASVHEGDLLARLIRPKEGKPGLNVYGKTVEVPKAKGHQQIRTGKGVRQEGDNYYAAENGRIQWTNDTLSVDRLYVIPEDVGPETGNISHAGDVRVGGDVLAGFSIVADGNLDISGTVEARSIKVGGNMTARGGITGGTDQWIEVGGEVQARFIVNATVLAGGDVVIEGEIVQSTVKTRGAVKMPNGRIVGGEVTAYEGIEVGKAGSPATMPTTLIVGVDYTLEQRLNDKQSDIKRLEKTLGEIRSVVERLTPVRESLPPQMKVKLEKLLATSTEREADLKNLQTQVKEARQESIKNANARIVVKQEAFPETTFVIQGQTHLVDRKLPGPVRVTIEDDEIKVS
jgi:uncharacterized protein (DUF342 family)